MSGRQLSRCPLGAFEYLFMPFNLTNAPTVFQALVINVLCDFDNCTFFNLDDILVFSCDPEEHVLYSHCWQVLYQLWENQLFLKADKLNFYAKFVLFLCYIVGRLNQTQRKSRLWSTAVKKL